MKVDGDHPEKAIFQKKLDIDLENCLGKYSDSYEHAIEGYFKHMIDQSSEKMITHSTDLLDKNRGKNEKYLMGGNMLTEPVYDVPLHKKK